VRISGENRVLAALLIAVIVLNAMAAIVFFVLPGPAFSR
jgi:hypothetical protein